MRGLYTLAIRTYAAAVKVAALFDNAKAKLWVEGRKRRPETGADDALWVWFHAASLGEFEQGRPLIEALKKQYPNLKISLTFFSPSGYEIRKNYPLADEVLYLPIDTMKNARRWVKRHRFVAAFFIKYEFWFNYMTALKEAQIPLYYISLILKPNQYFFRWYGGWFRKQLQNVTHFFVQDETTLNLLKDFNNVTLCGDTRFDRVADIAKQAQRFPEIEAFIAGRKCIIAGSSWPPDEKLLIPNLERLPEDYCMIIAPHDISEKHIQQIREGLRNVRPDKVYVVDTIGMLSQLYQYARFVYIGGGFGVNIHNIQEPVTFGCPVVFGPKYKSFKEAVDLVGLNGAFSVNNQDELNQVFDRLINDETFCQQASATCKSYLESQLGATEVILKKITSTFSF
ncbi:MAG: 3-deoxy-D-manno-octulosonic acid transferase [Bacteroidales bacterium]|nr:3-deoxy-D-manno-octulosonic acid transferase [Bacteroidales bacterium]